MKGALFMQIKFHEESRLFQLDSKNSTYAFQINEGGYLVHLYYGKKLSYLQGLEKNAFRGVYDSLSPQNPYVDDPYFSLDIAPLEFPCNEIGRASCRDRVCAYV